MGCGSNNKIKKISQNVSLIDIILHEQLIYQVDEKTRTFIKVLDSAFAYATSLDGIHVQVKTGKKSLFQKVAQKVYNFRGLQLWQLQVDEFQTPVYKMLTIVPLDRNMIDRFAEAEDTP